MLRLLWFDGENIAHHRMNIHLFDGVWSSSCDMYALERESSRTSSSIQATYYWSHHCI